MNILIVTQYFWPENFRINDLAKVLHDQGHTVTVLTGMPNYPSGKLFSGYGVFLPHRENYQGVTVFRVPIIPRGRAGYWRLLLNYLSFVVSASLLGPWYCRKQKYDVIFMFQTSPITAALPAILLKKMRNIPLLMWVQDLWPESLSAVGAVQSPRVLRWVGALVKFIYDRCDSILIQSRAFLEKVKAFDQPATKIHYVPNWAEHFYQPVSRSLVEPKFQASIPQGFIVMFAGNLGQAQSLPTLIEAARLLRDHRDIHWVILGDGRRRRWFEEQLQRLGLTANVRLLGQHPAELMPQYFALADVLVVSLCRDPIFALTVPSKIQSYLACGKPIIAALDGEGARIIEEAHAGFSVPAEDAPQLAQAVLSLYRMTSAQRALLGDQAREYFLAHFARDKLIDTCQALMATAVTHYSKKITEDFSC